MEPSPQQYCWDGYRAVIQAAHDAGLKVKVRPAASKRPRCSPLLCAIGHLTPVATPQADMHFHGSDRIGLPEWVLELGLQVPDIFFTDKSGKRNTSCLTLGVDTGERREAPRLRELALCSMEGRSRARLCPRLPRIPSIPS